MKTLKFIKTAGLLYAITILLLVGNSYSQDVKTGISLLKKGDNLGALNSLKSAGSGSDYDGVAYYGIALVRTGSLAEGEKTLKKAVGIDNERPEAYSGLGELYTIQKKYSDAGTNFENAKKYLPLSKTADQLDREEIDLIVMVLTKEAGSMIAQGKVDDAITSLTQAKIYDSKNPIIASGLGNAYLTRGAFDIAATNYNSALQYKPNDAAALYGLGRISQKKKKYNDAVDYYNKATDADKNFAPAYFEKGQLYYYSDKFDAALEAFEQFGKLNPGSARGEVFKGKTYYKKGELDKALEILNGVLASDPNNIEANKYVAYVLIDQKKYDDAEKYFDKVKEEEMEAEDLVKKADMYARQGNMAKANEYFEKAVKVDPDFEDAYFEWGKALFNAQTYDEALVKFGKAIDMGSTQVAAYVYKGICQYNLKDYAGGIESLKKSIELNPKISSAYLWLGNCQVAANLMCDAKKSYEKYLEFDPNDEFVKGQLARIECKQ